MASILDGQAVPFGKGKDPTDLVESVVERLLAGSALDRGDIDHVVVANAGAEGFCGIGNVATWTATQAGLAGCPAMRVETGPSSGLAAFTAATSLVDAGHAETVLLIGWEVMTAVSTPVATDLLAHYMAPDEKAHDLSLPGLVAMLTSAYQTRHGLSDGELALIPVKAHRLATSNPIAQFRKEITVDDVLASRIIADPLRLYHCAPMTDGAAALLVGSQGPVEVTGLAQATDHLGYSQRRTPPERFAATQAAGKAAFDRAGRRPNDIDVAEVHDAFSVLEAVNLEDLGFAQPGAGLDAIGLNEPLQARPVVNPSGGLKARGHPVGCTGVAQLVECYEQLTGTAANQVDDPQVALAHNIGGFGNNVHCAILEASR